MSESDCRTTIVLPVDLREQLVERAQAADRSISAEIRQAIREHISQPASSGAHPPSLGADSRRAALGVDNEEEQ